MIDAVVSVRVNDKRVVEITITESGKFKVENLSDSSTVVVNEEVDR